MKNVGLCLEILYKLVLFIFRMYLEPQNLLRPLVSVQQLNLPDLPTMNHWFNLQTLMSTLDNGIPELLVPKVHLFY